MRLGFKFTPGQSLIARAFVNDVQVNGNLATMTELAPGKYKVDLGPFVAEDWEGEIRIFNAADNSFVVKFPHLSTFVEPIPGTSGGTGPQGPAGPKGDTGNAGANGSQGIQGIQGPAGNVGSTGPAGPAPAGSGYVTVSNGSLNTPAAIPNVISAGNAGLMTGADKTKLDGIASGANLYVHPNHGGDVTSVADGAQTIAANVVTNAKSAQMATKTYKGRTSALTGNPEDVSVATLKADLALVKSDVGLGNCDNVSDANKPISSAEQTALNLKADLSVLNTELSAYKTLLQASGSHIAGKVAGTYAMGQGDPLAVSGTGTLYPIAVIHIVAADYPTVNGLAAKLRIRAQLFTNDVAPTGNFTFGLYPITRPATSGGTGVNIYTLGAVVAGSNGATFVTPAADGLLTAVGADFALPADGLYVIGIVTTGTIAVSAHVHANAILQAHNA